MRSGIITSGIAALLTGCGPEVDDEVGAPPGILEYEDPYARYYRSDRRMDVVAVDPMLGRSGCGLLTDRAYDDLTNTIAALDPSLDYRVQTGCPQSGPPKDLLYIEGFDHSPFSCAWYCCHEELIRATTVYFAVGSNLWGQYPAVDGEPYVALEPVMPCPD
jgi:hypothetical protein